MPTDNSPHPILASEQDLFDAVTHALMTQDGPSFNASGRPAYRAPNGRRCAIGHLIPDTLYREEIEGQTASFALRLIGMVRRCSPTLPYNADLRPRCRFLDALQAVHDWLPYATREGGPATYRRILAARLIEFAANHKLSDAAVHEALAAADNAALTPVDAT